MELTELKAADYGLEDNKAKQIAEQFRPMLKKMEDLEKTFNEILSEDITGDTCIRAKNLRTEYRKVRKGTEQIHKEQKAFYLQAGRFVDGWKNAQLFAGQGKEEKLKEIEQHFVNLEKNRIEGLQQSRVEEISQYLTPEAIVPDTLGEMHEEVWKIYLSGTKQNFELRQEAEKKAEAERLEKEKIENEKRAAEAQRQKEIEAENAKLKAEAEEQKRKIEEAAKKTADSLAAMQKEKEEAEAKAKAIQEAQERKEKEEADRLEKAAEAEAKKGDAAKVKDLISDIRGLKGKYSFKSKANKLMGEEVDGLLEKIAIHIENQ